jgi:hypothetical protein
MATVVGECAAVLCRLLQAVQDNEDPSSFKNYYTGLQRFGCPESNGNSSLSSTSTSKSGGFTCCVPSCFSNNKRNPEPSIYNFPSGKSVESKELRNNWISLILQQKPPLLFTRTGR